MTKNNFTDYAGYCDYYTSDDFIAHFGILGMKWGVRRYQNPDGSLTPAGQKRYGTAENFENVQKLKKSAKRGTLLGGPVAGIINGVKTQKKENIRLLTKDEIKAINEKQKTNASEQKGSDNSKNSINKISDGYREQKFNESKAKNIDLKSVRNHFLNNETKDRWDVAANEDKYLVDFLEIATNDDDYILSNNNDAKRKYLLNEYARYLEPYNERFK